MPPSRTVNGGSSTMAFSISSAMDGSASMLSDSSPVSPSLPRSVSLMSEACSRDVFRAIRSLAFAVPQAKRAVRRSRSYTYFRDSRRSLRSRMSSVSSSTAFRRFWIGPRLFRGCRSHCFILRDPIAVRQRSSTPSREPCTLCSNRVSVSSRFLIVALSRFMESPVSWICSFCRWVTSCFCVWRI